MKARIFNSGPVVYRINQVVENKVLQPEMLNEVKAPELVEFVNDSVHQEDTNIKGEEVKEVAEEPTRRLSEATNISEEDLQVLKEMENT
jgi:hypothetical protein